MTRLTSEGWIILALATALPLAVWFGLQVGKLREGDAWMRALLLSRRTGELTLDQVYAVMAWKAVIDNGTQGEDEATHSSDRRRL